MITIMDIAKVSEMDTITLLGWIGEIELIQDRCIRKGHLMANKTLGYIKGIVEAEVSERAKKGA